MKSFDAQAAQDSTAGYIAWAAGAGTHEASLGYMGELRSDPNGSDGANIFSETKNYSLGVAVTETWMLPEAEYNAAFRALITAAWSADEEEKNAWIVPDGGRGRRGQEIDSSMSFSMQTYLPGNRQAGARAVKMSTELMRAHFPFLGSKS
jgi:hypothetical protein